MGMTDKQFNSWLRLLNDRVKKILDETEKEKIIEELKALSEFLDESMKD